MRDLLPPLLLTTRQLVSVRATTPHTHQHSCFRLMHLISAHNGTGRSCPHVLDWHLRDFGDLMWIPALPRPNWIRHNWKHLCELQHDTVCSIKYTDEMLRHVCNSFVYNYRMISWQGLILISFISCNGINNTLFIFFSCFPWYYFGILSELCTLNNFFVSSFFHPSLLVPFCF